MNKTLFKFYILMIGFLLVGLPNPVFCELLKIKNPWYYMLPDKTVSVSGWGQVFFFKGESQVSLSDLSILLHTDEGTVSYGLKKGDFLIPLELYDGQYVDIEGVLKKSGSTNESDTIIVNRLHLHTLEETDASPLFLVGLKSKMDQNPEINTAQNIIQVLERQAQADMDLLTSFKADRRWSTFIASGQVGALGTAVFPIGGYFIGTAATSSLILGGAVMGGYWGVVNGACLLTGPVIKESSNFMDKDHFLEQFTHKMLELSGFSGPTNLIDLSLSSPEEYKEYKELSHKVAIAAFKINSSGDEVSAIENRVLGALDILYFIQGNILPKVEPDDAKKYNWDNSSLFDPLGPLKSAEYFSTQVNLIIKRLTMTLVAKTLWEMRRDLLELKLVRSEK